MISRKTLHSKSQFCTLRVAATDFSVQKRDGDLLKGSKAVHAQVVSMSKLFQVGANQVLKCKTVGSQDDDGRHTPEQTPLCTICVSSRASERLD
jgi:hypothetical protein